MKKMRRSGLKIMIKLINLLDNLKYIILIAVFGGVLGNTCAISVMVCGSMCVAKLIDPSFTHISLTTLMILTLLSGLLRGSLRFMEQYNNHYIAFKLLAALRNRLFGTLRKLAPARLEGKQKGALISMLTSDIETLEVFYAHTISPIMIALIVDGIMVILISRTGNIVTGIIALCAYLLIGIAVPFGSSALLKEEGVIYRAAFADSSSYFLDSIKGITEIIIYNNEAKRSKKLDEKSALMNEKTVSIKEKSALVSTISNLIVSIAILIELYMGIHFVLEGRMSLSHMIIMLVMLSSSFGPVLALAALPSNLTQTFASGDRLLDFMNEKPAINENEEGRTFEFETLKVENVNFSYDNESVLKDVSLEISKGEIIGLSGPSGCGKSTLLKLMLRFYDTDSGKISYNGINIKDIKTSSLHKNVTMVSQDTYLFDDTILNNLRVANSEATLKEVREACKKASIDDFIMSLPDGYDSECGLLGDALSAGEKQRIGLARAFLCGADLILLDEVTSNIDAMNEGIILKSLKEAKKDKTIILVSHRDSTVSICDKVYHLDKGRIQ